MIAVVAVAHGTAAPELGVAEFAPAARSQIEPPPTTAGATAAAGDRHSARQRATTTTTQPPGSAEATLPGANTAAVGTTRVGRSRACYGDPPRQSEDPMAPACIATIFEGGNGGATSRGVGLTEIRIAVPVASRGASQEVPITALFEYMNQRFEFYGRRLMPVFVAGAAQTALDARSKGVDVAGQGVFGAVTGAQEWGFAHAALATELARQQVVTVVRGAPHWWSDRTVFDPAHPYLWSVYPASEDVQANMADFACTGLAGRAAAHAGDPGLRAVTRRFGIVSAGFQDALDAGPLYRALTSCPGAEPVRVDWTRPEGDSALRERIERLRSSGVTTLICVCEANTTSSAINAAHAAGFHPEWILPTGHILTGYDEGWLQGPVATGQLAPPIRISPGPRLLPIQARPWFGALQAMLQSPPAGTSLSQTVSTAEFVYAQLLVMASGIQSAGPILTPDTFARGLMATEFPNPAAGAAPYWQPSAGFGPGDHSFYDDYDVAWWSPTAKALDPVSTSPTGSWCYLDNTKRFTVGSYPVDAAERLFSASAPCR